MSLKRWFYRDGAPKPIGPRSRPGHDRAAGAKQARVWEVGIVSGRRLFRICGLLVFVGALAFVLHVVLRSVLSAGVDPAVSAKAGLWVPLNALGALVQLQDRFRLTGYSMLHENSHLRTFVFG